MSAGHDEIFWPRPEWSDGGGEATLLWFVFGDYDAELPVDGTRYRTRGVPAGIELKRFRNADLAEWPGYPLDGALGRLLREEEPELVGNAASASECLMLHGTLKDPPSLDYLRDSIGLVTALVDLGGVAVVDPQMLSIFGPEAWQRNFFAKEAFSPRDHVLILCNEDEARPGRLHVHTRGLRKFARPDVSVRNVPPPAAGAAGQLAEHFVAFQANGGCVPEDYAIEIDDERALRVRHGGALDDPAFNNRHFELVWPD